MSHWEIADQQPFGGNGLRWHGNARVAAQAGMSPLEKTMWPPSAATVESAGFGSEATGEGLHMERCARLLPHDNDTGGFFLALIEKTAEIAGTAGRLATVCTPTGLAKTDLVPLDKCNESAAMQQSLKELAASEDEDLEHLKRRVWASAEGIGGILDLASPPLFRWLSFRV
jgi:hypothetical protein